MKFSSVIINSILAGLVILCLFGFMASFALQNQTNTTVLNDGALSAFNQTISNQVNSAQGNSTASLNAYVSEGSHPVLTQLGFYFFSIISAGNTFISLGVGLITSTLSLGQSTLNIPPIVGGTVLSILVIVLIFAVWRMLRAGE